MPSVTNRQYPTRNFEESVSSIMAESINDAPPQAPWWVLPGLALIVLVIFAGALAASCVLADNTLRTQMFTGSYGLASLAAGFFFGSSVGSRAKDNNLATVARDDKRAAAAIVVAKDEKIAEATVAAGNAASAVEDALTTDPASRVTPP